jgi:hypothetical protein
VTGGQLPLATVGQAVAVRRWSGRRALVAALLAITVVVPAGAVSGCSHFCASYEYSIASEVAASATQRGSLDAFLASPDGTAFPREGWGPPSSGVFRSGSAAVVVWDLPDRDGWAVVSAQTC